MKWRKEKKRDRKENETLLLTLLSTVVVDGGKFSLKIGGHIKTLVAS